MAARRTGGLMHLYKSASEPEPIAVSTVVDSIVLTSDVQKALGIDLGREGWFVGLKIHDPDVRKMVREGKLPALSIGGRGRRVPVEIDD
jgi:hypothetical protein